MVKKALTVLLFFMLCSASGFAEVPYYLFPLKISDIEADSDTGKYVNEFPAWFASALSNYSFTPVSTTDKARIIMKGFSFYFEERVIFHINIYDRVSNKILFEDETYTTFYTDGRAIKKSIGDLAERIAGKWKGEKLDVYSEYSSFNYEGTDTIETNAPAYGLQRIQFVSLADLNYFYPMGLEIGVLDIFMVWLSPGSGFGLGLGSELIDVYANMPGYTNLAGTFLPLKIIVPVYLEKDTERINDFYAVLQWAWYKPVQISETATNTNMNNFVQNPLNYIDLRLSYYFLPFASVSCGASYYYDKGNYYFYIGASLFLGYYKKE